MGRAAPLCLICASGGVTGKGSRVLQVPENSLLPCLFTVYHCAFARTYTGYTVRVRWHEKRKRVLPGVIAVRM